MTPFKSLVKNQWNKWEFCHHQKIVTHESSISPYCVIRFQDWKNYCLKDSHNISFKENDVIKIEKKDEFFEIILDSDEKVFAKTIYDSRSVTIKDDGLKQHFIGHVIKVDDGHQISNFARLMDFRVSQDQWSCILCIYYPYISNELLGRVNSIF